MVHSSVAPPTLMFRCCCKSHSPASRLTLGAQSLAAADHRPERLLSNIVEPSRCCWRKPDSITERVSSRGAAARIALRFDALTIPRPGMVNEMEWSEVDWDAERWTIPAAKMKAGWDHVVPLSRQALAILSSVQKLTGHRRYAFSCSKDAPLSNNTLNKRLRLLGIDTKTDHCAHGFRTTFSTLSHHEEIKDAKAWDGDVVELQLAHLDNSTVEGLYKKHGPLALIGSRTKLMQHWADRIDHWLDPKKVMPIKGGAQA